MGCALSTAEKDAVQRSLAIDKSLASEGAFRQNEIKLLLLGKLVFTVVIELYTSINSACKTSRVVPGFEYGFASHRHWACLLSPT